MRKTTIKKNRPVSTIILVATLLLGVGIHCSFAQDTILKQLDEQLSSQECQSGINAWIIIQNIIDQSSAHLVWQQDDLALELKKIQTCLASSSVNKEELISYKKALEDATTSSFIKASEMLLNYVNNPNNAGLYDDSIKQNTERLWRESRKLNQNNNATAVVTNLSSLLESLNDLQLRQEQPDYIRYKQQLANLLNLMKVLQSFDGKAEQHFLTDSLTTDSGVVGRIIDCKLGLISGWAYYSPDPSIPLAITIDINNRRFVLTANREMQGIAELNQINDPFHGFNFEFYDFDTGENKIKIYASAPTSSKPILMKTITLTIKD